MRTQAMTEIETGDLPVFRDTTGIVICMAGMKWADKSTFKWEKTRRGNDRKHTYIS